MSPHLRSVFKLSEDGKRYVSARPRRRPRISAPGLPSRLFPLRTGKEDVILEDLAGPTKPRRISRPAAVIRAALGEAFLADPRPNSPSQAGSSINPRPGRPLELRRFGAGTNILRPCQPITKRRDMIAAFPHVARVTFSVRKIAPSTKSPIKITTTQPDEHRRRPSWISVSYMYHPSPPDREARSERPVRRRSGFASERPAIFRPPDDGGQCRRNQQQEHRARRPVNRNSWPLMRIVSLTD